MKVRQLRKRKPASMMAQVQGEIRRALLRLLRGKALRNDPEGRRAIAGEIDRVLHDRLLRGETPPGCRVVISGKVVI